MKVQIGIPPKSLDRTNSSITEDIAENYSSLFTDSNISCTKVPQAVRHMFPGPEMVSLLFEFGSAASAGIIANWLYEKFKGQGTTIVIGKKEVRIENAEKLREIIISESADKKEYYIETK